MAYNQGNALEHHPIVVIIPVIAALITILVFLTGKENLKENLSEIREYVSKILGLTSSEQRPLTEDSFDDQKKAGVAAYHAGKYAEAQRLLEPVAAQGDEGAQAYLRFYIREGARRARA